MYTDGLLRMTTWTIWTIAAIGTHALHLAVTKRPSPFHGSDSFASRARVSADREK